MSPISNRKPFVSIPETKPAAESMPAAESSFFTVSLFSYGENGKTIRNSEPVPAAVPVVTAEEADKLNAEAIAAFEIYEQIRAKQRKRLEDGYGLTYSEDFNGERTVSLSKANEEQLSKRGYDLEEFKRSL